MESNQNRRLFPSFNATLMLNPTNLNKIEVSKQWNWLPKFFYFCQYMGLHFSGKYKSMHEMSLHCIVSEWRKFLSGKLFFFRPYDNFLFGNTKSQKF